MTRYFVVNGAEKDALSALVVKYGLNNQPSESKGGKV